MAANPAPAIQHRGAFIILNIITKGERSLAEYLAQSSMLEVLMALSQLVDITADSTLPPECIVLAQGCPMAVIRRDAISNRKQTKSAAADALKKLAEYKLIQPTV